MENVTVKPLVSLKWTTTIDGDNWEWLEGNKDIPQEASKTQSGEIQLFPHEGYWYKCSDLIIENVSYGHTFIQLWYDSLYGSLLVQARAQAPEGHWDILGEKSATTSQTQGQGGFNISVSIS